MKSQIRTQGTNSGLTLLIQLGKILRLTSLSLLFAGSAAIVFAAITLVKIGEAKGLTVSQVATNNAPVFIHFGRVAAAACVALLVAEAIDSFGAPQFSKVRLLKYAATSLCCVCAFTFSFFTAPAMGRLIAHINDDPAIRQSFQQLHQLSRLLFSGIILFAWASLVIPVFGERASDETE